jgi:hypothetical protein
MTDLGIDPETINRYVAKQIAESAIGDALKESIDAEVKRLKDSYNNPMKPVVASAIAAVAREYLDTPEVKERLRKTVEESLTDEVVSNLISRIVSEGFRQ